MKIQTKSGSYIPTKAVFSENNSIYEDITPCSKHQRKSGKLIASFNYGDAIYQNLLML